MALREWDESSICNKSTNIFLGLNVIKLWNKENTEEEKNIKN